MSDRDEVRIHAEVSIDAMKAQVMHFISIHKDDLLKRIEFVFDNYLKSGQFEIDLGLEIKHIIQQEVRSMLYRKYHERVEEVAAKILDGGSIEPPGIHPQKPHRPETDYDDD